LGFGSHGRRSDPAAGRAGSARSVSARAWQAAGLAAPGHPRTQIALLISG